jgi:hypothetical protein
MKKETGRSRYGRPTRTKGQPGATFSFGWWMHPPTATHSIEPSLNMMISIIEISLHSQTSL